MLSYHEQLTLRLATGIGELDEDVRQRHTQFLLNKQQPDGGFAGREGESDLYYTSFGLRSLAILGELHGDTAQRSADYLQTKLLGHESVVDFLSLIYGAKLLETAAGIDIFAQASPGWQQTVAETLHSLRRDDGGYAKGPEGMASSTYHTFLVLLCLQLIEQPIPDPQSMVKFLLSQESEEGGFREIRASKRAGTNPTAAAIGALRILNGLTEEIIEGTLDFLVEMQNDEGGLRANTRIPIADVLSTFTGMLTLTDLKALDEIAPDAALRYVRSLELPTGGFLGAAWDEVADVEYTFYGLGSLALLHTPSDFQLE
ncbi:beta-hydroxylase [Bremerella cremea]|uniref:Geranylgeranyl transferase type II subunit beta n=1 Tax=Bremerella cremea TaxID=1031537 RepID=A0A368KRA7_9BACT|nr:prenyltransferase/squalene oxidase repeat-containing protein [Bremerella cremea]RCS49394.1 beta-hydroxylase [Bremerella cremea]